MSSTNRHHIAKDGMVFTNGSVFVNELWLGTGDTLDNWAEITKEEAERIQEEQAKADLAAVGG